MSYGMHPTQYLERAQERLAEGTSEGLFYAAFELRCGVEGRMKQYLEAQSWLSKKQKKGYQIAELGRRIDSAFTIGDNYVRFTIANAEGQVLAVFHYTPVPLRLRKLAQRCGVLLHPQMKYRLPDDPWWLRTRAALAEMVQLLQLATKGALLGVPLKHPKGRLELPLEFPADLKLHEKIVPGATRVRVEYLTTPPPELLDTQPVVAAEAPGAARR